MHVGPVLLRRYARGGLRCRLIAITNLWSFRTSTQRSTDIPAHPVAVHRHYPFVTRMISELFNSDALTNDMQVEVEPEFGYVTRITYNNGKVRITRANDVGLNSGAACDVVKDKERWGDVQTWQTLRNGGGHGRWVREVESGVDGSSFASVSQRLTLTQRHPLASFAFSI